MYVRFCVRFRLIDRGQRKVRLMFIDVLILADPDGGLGMTHQAISRRRGGT